jgi:Spy/CpxP family protein refolding chaperone
MPGHSHHQEQTMKRRILTLSLLFAATLSAAAAAQDVPSSPDGSRMIRRIESRLGVTWDQRVQAKAILQQERPVLQQLHTQLEAEHAEMAQITMFNDTQVRAVAAKYAETNTDVVVERAKLRTELLAILTPAQQKKLTQLRTRVSAGMDERLLTLGDNL